MLRTYILLLFSLIGLEASGQLIFRINDFDAHENDLSINGHAYIEGDILNLTPAAADRKGSCWYSVDDIDIREGFETEFTFRIINNDSRYGGGDGFAFVIQDEGVSAIGDLGDAIGYKGIIPALAIELDTHDDQEGSKNHVCVSYYQAETNKYRRFATVHEIPEINDGKAHYARVEYKDGVLTFFLDSYLFPIVSTRLDIPKILNLSDNRAWLGFTSATSKAYGNHQLLKWTFKNQIKAPEDINESKIKLNAIQTLKVRSRDLTITVRDHNKVDGDVISLKANDEWLISQYELTAEKKTIFYTVTGFESKLILFANNVGKTPPNTVTISINDGFSDQKVVLEADLNFSQGIQIFVE